MGSKPKRSSRPRKSPVRSKRLKIGKPPRSAFPDLHAILEHFAAGLSIVETAARAFKAAEDDMEAVNVGAEISTLRQGIKALQAVYNELDAADCQLKRAER